MVFQGLKYLFFMMSKPITKSRKATRKAATPMESKIKILPSQSPNLPKILEDLMVLSSIMPA